MKHISIVPYAGLCNRMRTISSGIFAATHINIPIFVYWNRTHDCFAHWLDLFQPIEIDGVKLIENTNPIYKIDSIRNLHLPKVLHKFIFDQRLYGFSKNYGEDIISYLNKVEGEKTLIQSCCDLCDHYPVTELFKPAKDVEDKISKIVMGFKSTTVGIHIRRSDNAQSIKSASIDDFKRKIVYEMGHNYRTNFYLATDDVDIKYNLQKEFGDLIISPELETTRSSVSGMKDAVVDLFCLSKTRKIIGSYYSSYSDMAAELGNISLEICRNNL